MPNLVFDRNEVQKQFLKALRGRHLQVEGPLLDDGVPHRCNATNKEGNRGKGDGWYVLYTTGWPAGSFQNRTDGKGKENWKFNLGPNAPRISASELQRQMGELRRAQAEASAKRRRDREQAAVQAATTWDDAEPATASHPYLHRKRIKPHGLRLCINSLLVPIYVPGCETPVSLQFVDANGDKRFLEKGRAGGGYFYLRSSGTEETHDIICIAEGFATAATINETTGYAVYVAFYADNLLAIARMAKDANPTARIVICADDDWDTEGNPGVTYATKAATAIGAHLAIPEFDLSDIDRMPDFTDFNDVGRIRGPDRVRNIITAALERGIVLAEIIEADVTEDRDARDRRIAAIAAIADPIEREQQRNVLAKVLKVSRSTLAEEVNKVRSQITEVEEKPRPTRKQLRASARDIIACENVLDLFVEDFRKRVAGEETNAKLLYLGGTSRLLDECMNIAMKGPSAGGKSRSRDSVLAYFPPEEVIAFTMISEKALMYMEQGFEHKILSMAEAYSPEELKMQDYLLRVLMSEGKLSYPVTQKQPDGSLKTITIEKEGPVAFMVTTTRNKLNPENETRLLSLEVDESEAQTKRVLLMTARTKGENRNQPRAANFQKWHDYQRWLGRGECRVVIPFASTLSKLVSGTRSVRVRRDFGQLLHAIKVHALLHRAHRERRDDGVIIANISTDYAVVRKLMLEVMATASEIRMRQAIADTVNAVEEIAEQCHTGATVSQVGDRLHLDRSTAYRRLRAAESAGYIINVEERKGRPARFEKGESAPKAVKMLPTVTQLKEAYQNRRQTAFSPALARDAVHGEPKTPLSSKR